MLPLICHGSYDLVQTFIIHKLIQILSFCIKTMFDKQDILKISKEFKDMRGGEVCCDIEEM